MDKQIVVSIKRKAVYGVELIYVCEPSFARAIGQLTGKKTVGVKDIEALRELGVGIRDIDAEIEKIVRG